ncbi:LysR family transcriptional regulator, partial [Burkholderia cenocepacia]|uniref:LysR family transcriptional regulator n=1 Tax=Burkholderia cenocepacia TaxID=95486 RepID=UPI0021AB40BF
MKTLDIEAVQAFVLTADLKSFTRAAEALDTTQSAVSLKIKRLEDGLGRRLLERTPRQVRLSADGTAFLEPARELVAAHHGALGAFGGFNWSSQHLQIGGVEWDDHWDGAR